MPKIISHVKPFPPSSDAIVLKYIVAIRSDLEWAISRSYAVRSRKSTTTELAVNLHHSRPDRVTVKIREEQTLDRHLNPVASLEPEVISPLELDNLSLNLNECIGCLQRQILPAALSSLAAQLNPLSSLDLTLRFAKGRLRSHTLRVDVTD